jgi:signal peptidase I
MAVGVVVPGMGHVYAGRANRGVVLWICALAASVLLLTLSMVAPTGGLRVLLLAMTAVPSLLVLADAFRTARAEGARRPGWPVLLAWLVALLVVQSQVFDLFVARVARAFSISGGSMAPTLLAGDYVLFSPHRGGPVERGAVIVHEETGPPVVARVVGLPGDTLAMRAGRLTVDGRPLAEPYAFPARGRGAADGGGYFNWQRAFLPAGVDSAAYRPTASDWGPIVLPAGSYLTLGDNRADAFDGRHTGFVHEDEITYRARWIYLSRPPLTGSVRWSRIGRRVR